MNTTSFWENTAREAPFSSLTGEVETDVVIIGGGITGVSAAHLLSRAGKRVVLLEAMSIGEGTTGYSTGNLYATVDNHLYRIRDKWSQETATAVAKSRSETIDAIEATVAEYGLQCGFVRCPQYLVATDEFQVRQMMQEHETALNSGLAASLVDTVPLPLPKGRALKLDHQAQFHPLLYVRMLAKAVASNHCQFYEQSRVTAIDDEKRTVTTTGGSVRFQKLLMATHTPKGFNVLQTELGPYREYGIAARLTDESYPEGIFWTLEEPSHSVRTYAADGAKYLIVIGEKHKTGQHGDTDYYQRVEAFTRSHFPVQSIEYRWSAQHYRSADELPYIGRSTASEEVYLATGFATNGLVYGPLAAAVITDDILGKKNPWSDLYDAKRFTPVKSAGSFLHENLDVVKQYARDYLTRADLANLEDLRPGQGGVVEVEGRKHAVYLGEDGEWTVLSPVCTHLGCLVHWNDLEKSWDCPCHGSRFRCDGEVLEGPAICQLEKRELRPEG